MTREQFLFLKLAEEASEISQIALKTIQFGPEEKHPQLSENNVQRVCAEVTDLLGIVKMLEEEFGHKLTPNIEALNNKRDKVNKYYGYSQNLGMVDV